MSNTAQVLFKNDVALVRLMTLEPNEIGEKHYHTHLVETVICIEGEISLFVIGSKEPTILCPGHQASVAARLHHWLQNNNNSQAQYLLAQSGGTYDFLSVKE